MMKLGIISHYDQKALDYVKSKNLSYVEFTINKNEHDFFDALTNTKMLLEERDLHVISIGRWGTERLTKQGINKNELNINLRMIDACAQLGSPVYVTGVNYVSEISEDENIKYAITYLKTLTAYAKERNVKVAVYNCRWNNFIVGPNTWDIFLQEVPGLGIKYDPSHAIYDHQDYLKEMSMYAKHIYHIHLKGSLIINQERIDDPPAGLDMTDWKAVMALLYVNQYDGGLSIEPHSHIWKDQLGDFGIDYTISYFKPMIFGGK